MILKWSNFISANERPSQRCIQRPFQTFEYLLISGKPIVVKNTAPRVVDGINLFTWMVQKHNKTSGWLMTQPSGRYQVDYLAPTWHHNRQACGQRSRRWVARRIWWELFGMRLSGQFCIFLTICAQRFGLYIWLCERCFFVICLFLFETIFIIVVLHVFFTTLILYLIQWSMQRSFLRM